MSAKKLVSIIIPAYREEKNIPMIYTDISEVFCNLSDRYDHEIVFVNDGSPDGTWSAIEMLCESDVRVK